MVFIVVILAIAGVFIGLWPGGLGPALVLVAGILDTWPIPALTGLGVAVAGGLAVLGWASDWIALAWSRRRYPGREQRRRTLTTMVNAPAALLFCGLVLGPFLGTALWRGFIGGGAVDEMVKGSRLAAVIWGARLFKVLLLSVAAAMAIAAAILGAVAQ